jgi:hypothetical protein
MAAEDALTRGDWAVAHGARNLNGLNIEDLVRPWRRKVTIVANLQLDAMHTYVGVPDCEVVVGGTPIVIPVDRRTTPISSLPYSGRSGMTTSLVGATLESDFDAETIGQTSRPAIVVCERKEVARWTIDFARLE